jgi:phosphate transport system permease protein
VTAAAPAQPRRRGLSTRRRLTNSLMLSLAGVAAVIAVVPLVWIVVHITLQAAPALSLEFLTSLPTPVGVAGGGVANAIVGSFMTVGLGLALAAPVGLAAGMYAAARPDTRLGVLIRFATDTLAGVPSIVMGIFAYSLVVLPQGHFSALAGGVVLAFIMLPILIRTTEEMLKLVPGSLREGSLALGAPDWRTSLRVLVPAAASGIVTGIMLAVARAAGEAAPMLFTAFGNPFMNTDFSQPVATLPHTVFVYAISPYEDWRAKAWATAFVLIAIVLILNITARGLSAWRSRRLQAPGR